MSTERTVLIADDREENRYVTQHTLQRAGFSTLQAVNGQEALEKAKTMPDVIVLDVRLPDMLGYEVCRRLRANPQTCHIPVLQLSAIFLNTESKLYALESGADAYLPQPADPLVLVATVRSLIRLHDAERQARQIARQWSATFDALSEGVAMIDQGKVQRCNRAMTELLDASYSELENSTYVRLLEHYFKLPSDAFEGVSVLPIQLDNRFFRLNLTPLPENDGTSGSILIVAEVTPQKQAEQALLLNERLAATGRMAHTIAHEINNPLEAITNLIYLAQHTSDPASESQSYLATAASEVQRISEISRQILSFHREASTPVTVPIAELVEDVLALSARVAWSKKVVTTVKADRTLRVNGYPARLRQVFSNIIRNAIEASSENGALAIRISRAHLSRGPLPVAAVRVTVADHGMGIPPEFRARIFEAFFTTKEQKGSGVGLWLTHAIVQEHEGKLQVRSCTELRGSGTVFSVLLPQA